MATTRIRARRRRLPRSGSAGRAAGFDLDSRGGGLGSGRAGRPDRADRRAGRARASCRRSGRASRGGRGGAAVAARAAASGGRSQGRDGGSRRTSGCRRRGLQADVLDELTALLGAGDHMQSKKLTTGTRSKMTTAKRRGDLVRRVHAYALAERQARDRRLTGGHLRDVLRRRLPRSQAVAVAVEATETYLRVLVAGQPLAAFDRDGQLACPAAGVAIPHGVPRVGTPQFEAGRRRFHRVVAVIAAQRARALGARGRCGARARAPRARSRARRSANASRAGPGLTGADAGDGPGEPGRSSEALTGRTAAWRRP